MAARHNEAEHVRMKQILTETIVDLCHAVLGFDTEMRIDGLLGITIDQTDVLLISISEVIILHH